MNNYKNRVKIGGGKYLLKNINEVVYIEKIRLYDLLVEVFVCLFFVFYIYIPALSGMLLVYAVLRFLIYKEIRFNIETRNLIVTYRLFGIKLKSSIGVYLSQDFAFHASLTWQYAGEIYDRNLIIIELWDCGNKYLFGRFITVESFSNFKRFLYDEMKITVIDSTNLNNVDF